MASAPLEAAIAHWIRPEVRRLHAYHVPPAQGMVKLDAMENPYTLPPELVDAWLEALRGVELNRYPDAEARELRARLRDYLEIPAQSGLLLGNGSDEIIQMVAMAVAAPGRTLLAPDPSFVMYRLIAEMTGMHFVGVPLLEPEFALDTQAMLEAIERHQPAVVFLAYPNNPTGNLFERPAVEAVLEASPGLVVLDEAYHSFAGETWMGALERHPQLLVMRTLSKLGLAGLRIGVLAGAQPWLEEINKLRLPYNLNVLAQVSAAFLLSHSAVLDEQARRIREDRERLREALGALPGVEVWPSRTNFVLLRVPGGAGAAFEGLKAQGVLIKNLDGSHPLLEGCLRVTVGTPEENSRLVEALRGLLKGGLRAG